MNNHYPYVNAICAPSKTKFSIKAMAKLAKTDKPLFQNFSGTGLRQSDSASSVEELIDQELLSVKAMIDELTPKNTILIYSFSKRCH